MDISSLLQGFLSILLKDVAKFWMKYSLDTRYSGFLTGLNCNSSLSSKTKGNMYIPETGEQIQ